MTTAHNAGMGRGDTAPGLASPKARSWTAPLAVAVLLLGCALFGYGVLSASSRTAAIAEEVALIDETQRLLTTLFSSESSERGFVLTGSEAFRQPYDAGLVLIDEQIATVRSRFAASGADAAQLQALEEDVRSQIDFAQAVVGVREAQGFEAAAELVRSGEGRIRMDAVRASVGTVQDGASQRIETLRGERASAETWQTTGFMLAALAALALGLLSVRRQREARRSGEAQNRFRALVEATAAMVWSASSAGHFGGRQDSWSNFTGQKEDDYSGFGWTNAIQPEDRERSQEAWTRATATGTPYSIEHRVRDRNGEWHDMLANAIPIMAADGTVREWIGTHTDVTEHRKTAALLSEAHSQFQSLADNIPQMAWMAEPDGSIFWYNRRWFEFTGTTLEEMRGYGWVSVHHPDHEEQVRAGYEAALAEGRPWEDTFPLRGADGAYRWFLSQALPIRGEDGTILRWFGTNTDVTRRREQERELAAAKELAENANRAKSQFIANMSHELRTPLTAVIGYTEMLEEEAEETGADHLLGDLGKIRGNARHLLGLINDVLDLSKIEAERMEIHAETFEVATVVEEIASTVGSLMETKQNRLELDLAPDLGQALTDQMKLRQCLINLLSNASKFTEKGTIRLTVRRERQGNLDHLVFDVSDEGIGMSDEQLSRLFQRFTQADTSTTRKFGGTGLGLAITKAFCKLLGGDIAVSSREGEGSTFTIKIPALVSPVVVETQAAAPVRAEERASSAGVVLAIDDDPAARDLVSRFLTREGFIVRTAADGVAGLEMARLSRPDVILLDVTMPRMDGWSVLSALKGDADLSRIPVVMLTVIDEHSLGYALGASDYLLKPVEWDQLRKVMDRFRTAADALVLAVDDDADLLARMRASLEREGFRVMTAVNGRDALAELEKATPDIILTDLVMPQMDGFAFIRAARARAQTVATPIIVLTSKDLTREEFRQLRNETQEVIAKQEVALSELAEQLRVIVGPDRAGSLAKPGQVDSRKDQTQ